MASDSYKELILVERKTRKLTIDTLLNDNDNIQILLIGFDIEEELPIALSGRKSQEISRYFLKIFDILWTKDNI